MALAQGALGRLAHGGEGVVEDVVDRVVALEAFAERVGAGAQIVVRQRLERGLEVVDRGDRILERLEHAVVGGAEQPLRERL